LPCKAWRFTSRLTFTARMRWPHVAASRCGVRRSHPVHLTGGETRRETGL
jgi:hypothetical protein